MAKVPDLTLLLPTGEIMVRLGAATLVCGVGLWRLALMVMNLALAGLPGGIWLERWIHRYTDPQPTPPPER